jgi:hypothetical protein
MALSLSTVVLTSSTRNSLATSLLALIDAGTQAVLELRDNGTPGSGTLLASIPLDATASFTVSGAVLTCDVSPVPSDSSADATGVPLSWQLKTQTGGTVICEGAVSGGDTINSGQPVNLTSFTITIGA